FLMMLTVMKL
ncbi:hypothetical protein, partial [Plasmodium yoelii yoelii]